MAVTGNFGKEDIELRNAAEETTLRRLTDIMASAFGKGSLNPKTISDVNNSSKKTSRGLDELADDIATTGTNLHELETETQGVSKGFKKFSGDLKYSVQDMIHGFKNADPAAMLKGMADAAKTGLEGLGGAIGMAMGGPMGAAVGAKIGAVAGDIAKVLAGVAGVVAGETAGLTQNFQELSKVGLVAGDGVTTFSRAVVESGSTLGQFVDTVKTHSADLAAMGGSVTQGSKQFLSMRRSLRVYEEDFIKLGYSYQEMNDTLAEFTSSLSKGYGPAVQMSNQQVAQKTAEYAKNLKIVSDITGKNAKELKEQNNQLHNAALTAGTLQDLANQFGPQIKQQYDDVGSAVDMLGPTAKKLYEEYMGMGQAVSKTTGLYEANAPTQAAAIKDLVEKLKNGGFESASAQKDAILKIQELSKTDAAQREQRGLLELEKYSVLGQGNSVLAELTTNAGQVNEQMGNLAKTNVEEVIKNVEKALTPTKDIADEGTQAMIAQSQSVQKLMLAQNSVSISMVNAAGVLVAKSLNTLADKVLGAAEDLRVRSKPEADANRGVSMVTKFEAAAADLATAIPRAFGGVAEDIASWFGKEKGWAIDKTTRDSMTPYTDEWVRAKEYSEGSNLTAPVTPDSYSDLEKRVMDRYNQEHSDIQGLNERFDTLQRQIEESQRSLTDQTSPRPRQALGSMFDYKPGGYQVTVGEVGDEIVAPAKRGPDGKMGLEVSGIMLDNSRLLQSLADTSKNQINVMSAVNDKMSNLVANMEKFARAQEQANRLAS